MVLAIIALTLEAILMATFGVLMFYAPIVYLSLTPVPLIMAIISLFSGMKAKKNDKTRAKGILIVKLSATTLCMFSLLIVFVLMIIIALIGS